MGRRLRARQNARTGALHEPLDCLGTVEYPQKTPRPRRRFEHQGRETSTGGDIHRTPAGDVAPGFSNLYGYQPCEDGGPGPSSLPALVRLPRPVASCQAPVWLPTPLAEVERKWPAAGGTP